ncbi:HlyD family efflux transporter periplasmic adaptor subunit [Bacillus smithii]|uniref:HlyD family efflux transporter periplasmic adaptor subunit n=1 Tax=Bacillus smithii TaxID=1479 RepID=UPI0030C9D115
MARGRLVLLNLVGIIVVILLLAGGAYYYYQTTNYLKTDDAKVSADMVPVVATTSGKLVDWTGEEGDKVLKDDLLGKISDGKTTIPVTSPEKGTIIKNQVQKNQIVQAGQTLAQTADLSHLYIVANIKETDLKDIEKGDKVTITVDGDPNTTFDGKVEKIGYATNSVFSLLPEQNSSGNYTKVTQKVPVKISIKDPSDKVLPGMNAEVKISK